MFGCTPSQPHMWEMFVYYRSAGRQVLACVYTVLFFILVAVCSVRTCCHMIAGCLNYLVKICVTMEHVLLFCTDSETPLRHHCMSCYKSAVFFRLYLHCFTHLCVNIALNRSEWKQVTKPVFTCTVLHMLMFCYYMCSIQVSALAS